jgi:hypothetical protein
MPDYPNWPETMLNQVFDGLITDIEAQPRSPAAVFKMIQQGSMTMEQFSEWLRTRVSHNS